MKNTTSVVAMTSIVTATIDKVNAAMIVILRPILSDTQPEPSAPIIVLQLCSVHEVVYKSQIHLRCNRTTTESGLPIRRKHIATLVLVTKVLSKLRDAKHVSGSLILI